MGKNYGSPQTPNNPLYMRRYRETHMQRPWALLRLANDYNKEPELSLSHTLCLSVTRTTHRQPHDNALSLSNLLSRTVSYNFFTHVKFCPSYIYIDITLGLFTNVASSRLIRTHLQVCPFKDPVRLRIHPIRFVLFPSGGTCFLTCLHN